MNCEQCQENIVAFMEDLLDQLQADAMATHLQDCPACQAEADELSQLRDKLLKDGVALSQQTLDNRVMDLILREQTIKMRRITMIKRYTKVGTALAATIAIIVGLSILVFNQSVTPAYALEQTLEANKGIKYLHIRIDPAGNGVGEAWAQIDENGELLLLRMDFPKTMDGPKVTIWQKDKATVWFKAKKSVMVVKEPNMVARIPEFLALSDPRIMFESLYQKISAGKVQAEIQDSPDAGGSINLIITTGDVSDRREIFRVNRETKLVEWFEKQRLNADTGEYETTSRHEYLDYNQPIDLEIFVLSLPEDIMYVDQTTQEVGLSKGDLSDEEIAVKVSREFYEALIAKDYAKAGKICSGIPAAKMKEYLGSTEYVRIISIGQPTPHPDPRTRFLCVPCEIEVLEDGVKSVKEFVLNIRAIYGQPDRWAVGGGI